MNFLKRVLNFILFGNIYVALGAVCLIQSTAIQIRQQEQLLPYSFLVFFATLFVYNFQRVFYKKSQDTSLNSIRRVWIFKNQQTIKLLIAIGMVGSVITFFLNDIILLLYLSPLLLLSVIYFAPFVKLRKSPWLKLLTLVFVWTMVTAVLPCLLSNSGLTENNVLHIFIRFFFMVAICIPFDIRDLRIDKADSVSTIPHLIGEDKARWLAFGCMLFYMILIIPEYTVGMISLEVFIALQIAAVINSVLVLKSTSRRSEYFYVAGIDGTMIIQGVLLMLVYYGQQ
ncbi:MAG: UbiA family prenyltransferase [Bacteroidota bacterium]